MFLSFYRTFTIHYRSRIALDEIDYLEQKRHKKVQIEDFHVEQPGGVVVAPNEAEQLSACSGTIDFYGNF